MLVACSLSATPSPTPTWTTSPSDTSTATIVRTIAPPNTQTPTWTISPSPSSTPTNTVTPTLTPTLAPLELFATRLLRQGVQAQSYLADNCSYLQMRWSPEGSQPGTVVVPIMFHSIVQDGTQVTDQKDITAEQFNNFVDYARQLGFETITTQELLEFLTSNAPIPPRSMMIIVDDRRPGLIRDWLMPALEKYDWTATSAYIADPNSLQWAWDLMDQLYKSGKLDVQSHGYTGQLYIVPETPLDKIQNEIWDSTQVLMDHFGKRPIAFIWPGGNFTPLSVQVARQGGYELGFSAYSRGPLLFNWIPLGAEERAVNDPLMVLPRAWSNSVNVNLDEAVRISEQAVAFAKGNFSTEAAWYKTYCGGELSNNR
jgi:peptidoglycan/xylan/chitin deacetylase (PgdA/CDA1 family)